MKKLLISISTCTIVLTAGAATPDGLDFARQKNCLACHALDKKLVGPSFNDIANKYQGKADAVSKLTEKVMKGGAGTWGPVPMPANGQVTSAEAQSLVTWVLLQK